MNKGMEMRGGRIAVLLRRAARGMKADAAFLVRTDTATLAASLGSEHRQSTLSDEYHQFCHA